MRAKGSVNKSGLRTLSRLAADFAARMEFEELRVSIQFFYAFGQTPRGTNRDVARWLKLAERFAS